MQLKITRKNYFPMMTLQKKLNKHGVFVSNLD